MPDQHGRLFEGSHTLFTSDYERNFPVVPLAFDRLVETYRLTRTVFWGTSTVWGYMDGVLWGGGSQI